jgi:hypothetical protein
MVAGGIRPGYAGGVIRLLSDRGRGAKLAACLGLLLLLALRYDHLARTVPVNWERCLEDPVAHDGHPLTMALWRVTRIDGPDRYAVSRVLRDVPVQGPTAGLALGQTVSVVGRFEAQGPVVVEELRRAHPWRAAKTALGALGAALALGSIPLLFRVRAGRVEARWPTS